jgi:hypothetical protein
VKKGIVENRVQKEIQEEMVKTQFQFMVNIQVGDFMKTPIKNL